MPDVVGASLLNTRTLPTKMLVGLGVEDRLCYRAAQPVCHPQQKGPMEDRNLR